jgi:GNAT superfamily N-acetyltransferase
VNRTASVRRFASDEWRKYRAIRLRALAESPEAFGSTLAQEHGRTDADWSDRLASGTDSALDLPRVAEIGPEPVGLAWGRVDPSERALAHLYQMWVDPDFRGMGVGGMLLDTAIAWARDVGARFLVLSVTCGDTPAARLYARAGFTPVRDPEPIRPGSPTLAQPLQLELHAAGGRSLASASRREGVSRVLRPRAP